MSPILVTLNVLSPRCHMTVIVLCFLLTVPWVGLQQCVTMAFTDHTHCSVEMYLMMADSVMVDNPHIHNLYMMLNL